MRVVKIGLALIGATVLGTWATRRTSWNPLWRGIARAGGAGLAAYLVRKRMPNAAIGLGTYAVATLAGGAVEQYDMSRYLSMGDQQRAALGQGSGSGAGMTGGTATGTGQIPAGSGDTGLEALVAYRSQGYATL
jgi:hypothetical protein